MHTRYFETRCDPIAVTSYTHACPRGCHRQLERHLPTTQRRVAQIALGFMKRRHRCRRAGSIVTMEVTVRCHRRRSRDRYT